MKVTASSFAQVHLYAVELVLAHGDSIPTDYDRPDEPPSLDLPLMIEVVDSWNPPIFSKCVWDDARGLFAYKDEVLYGTHDYLADVLSYTYHDRFKLQESAMLDELKRSPCSRRAQMITWVPEVDQGSEYPPCFQRAIIRVRNGRLDFHSHWRSRDGLKAFGSNVFAFAHLHKKYAEELGFPIGIYREFIDSFHVYGRDIERARKLVRRPLVKWEWSLEDILKDAMRESL